MDASCLIVGFSEMEAQGFLLRRGFDPKRAEQACVCFPSPKNCQATPLPDATGRLQSPKDGAAFVITGEPCCRLIYAGKKLYLRIFSPATDRQPLLGWDLGALIWAFLSQVSAIFQQCSGDGINVH